MTACQPTRTAKTKKWRVERKKATKPKEATRVHRQGPLLSSPPSRQRSHTCVHTITSLYMSAGQGRPCRFVSRRANKLRPWHGRHSRSSTTRKQKHQTMGENIIITLQSREGCQKTKKSRFLKGGHVAAHASRGGSQKRCLHMYFDTEAVVVACNQQRTRPPVLQVRLQTEQTPPSKKVVCVLLLGSNF